ncbi:MAG: hypothetical protein QXP91_12005 [Candidatus Methanomethylicia archaeon]
MSSLTDEDILGLIEVEVKNIIQSKSMKDVLVFVVKYGGKEYRIGVIGKEALESVKKHGYKTADNVIYLKVPKTTLREGGCGWINSPY